MTVGALLLLLTILVYLPVKDFGFVGFDDPYYASRNRQVERGVTMDGIRYAFGTFHTGNWHPLTWVSLMADVQLFGPGPRAHHLTNVALHAASAVLLALVLGGLTGAAWPAAFIAALFAVHPLHVESVAWISERKDVLSGLFFMLTLVAYARYIRRPSPARYVALAVVFALGLLAKPMLVTLPIVLLLLDYWPLGRLAQGHRGPPSRLLIEKLPLFALSAASCVVTFQAQRSTGAVRLLTEMPLFERLGNAVRAVGWYAVKMLWPSDLAFFYPVPSTGHPPWQIALPAAGLLIGCVAAVLLARRQPWLPVGLAWYLVTLLPVIGLVQVGDQAMADRYTYLPLIGLFLASVWGLLQLTAGMPRARRPGLVLAVGLLALLSLASRRQVGFWRDDFTLGGRALEATENNWLALNQLAVAHGREGRVDLAEDLLRQALRIRPVFAEAWVNWGVVLAAQGRFEEEIESYRRAIALGMDKAETHFNLGRALSSLGRHQEAAESYRSALRLDPGMNEAASQLALTYRLLGGGQPSSPESR